MARQGMNESFSPMACVTRETLSSEATLRNGCTRTALEPGGGNLTNDHKEDTQRNSKKHKKGLVDEGDEGKTRTSEEEAGQPNQTGGGGNRPVIPLQTEGDMDLH